MISHQQASLSLTKLIPSIIPFSILNVGCKLLCKFQVQPGTLNIISAEEKGLTLEDTQGMFLLLAAGFLMAATALMSEWMGGFTRKCRRNKKGLPSSADSRDHLITTPKSNVGNELKVTDTDSRLHFDTRPSSVGSRDTLEGEIINVTEESIIVHSTLDTDGWDSRRSSSVDLDREVKEIFEKDMQGRIVSDELIELEDEDKNEETASNGAFGNHLK